MRIPEGDLPRFEELDDQRRRIMDEFNLMVMNMRTGMIDSYDRARLEAQVLHTRHQGIIREMLDLLVG